MHSLEKRRKGGWARTGFTYLLLDSSCSSSQTTPSNSATLIKQHKPGHMTLLTGHLELMTQSIKGWILHHKEETSWNWRTSPLSVKVQMRWHHLTVYLLTVFYFEVFSNMLFKSWFIYSQQTLKKKTKNGYFLFQASVNLCLGVERKIIRWGKSHPEGVKFLTAGTCLSYAGGSWRQMWRSKKRSSSDQT